LVNNRRFNKALSEYLRELLCTVLDDDHSQVSQLNVGNVYRRGHVCYLLYIE